mgnify:CR=1 FL=1
MKELTIFNNFATRKVVIILALLCITLVVNTNFVQAEDKIMEIGLINNSQSVELNAKQGIRLETSDGYSLELTKLTHFKFERTGQFIKINNYFFASDYIMVTPLGGQLLNFKARNYNGRFKLINNPQGITVVNKVAMTDYLASVIGSEIDPDWPLAALKAQAVVARTYALRNLDSHASKGYHLSNTIYSQAYKGYHVTTPKLYQAVRETAGEVLTYQGQLISAVYHSNAGGETAQGAVIWGGNTPYLQSVKSKDHVAPNYQWQKKYSQKQLKRILNSKQVHLNKINEINLAGLGPSGRAKEVIIVGDKQKIKVDSSDFRFWLDLRSTKFSVNKVNNGYLFKGKGWGHGVGMSQWGAYQMAQEGYTYQKILDHYYQNTKLVKKDVGGIDDEG